MTSEAPPRDPHEQTLEVARSWYVPPAPPVPRGILVYSLDFVLATLQGCVTERHRVRRTPGWLVLGTVVRCFMAVLQIAIMILASLPIVDWFVETFARVFTRNAVGFFLRACYWKAKLRRLGQDTIFDQGVDIWGPNNVVIGSHCHIDTNVRIAAGERQYGQRGWVHIGDYVHLGPGVHIAGRGGVEIGNFVGISSNAHVYSVTGVIERPEDPGQLIMMSHMAPHDQQFIVERPVVVEEFAFIGMMARIMPGVRVGYGAVVHANCELTSDAPPFANVGGVPRGRRIGRRRPRRHSPRLTEATAAAAVMGAPLSGDPVIRQVQSTADAATLSQVVALHMDAFPDGVTTHLGRDFVQRYYAAMVTSRGASLWVAEERGRVFGFMGCATDRRFFERTHRSGAAQALAMWRFVTLRLSPFAVVRALRKQRLSHGFSDRAELLSIVVSPRVRRGGLGRRFLKVWIDRLREVALGSFVVFTDNPEGISFYEKYGGECLFKFKLRGVLSACYRFRLGDAPLPQRSEPIADVPAPV